MKTKRCYKCDTYYSLSNFFNDKSRYDGLSPICKQCEKIRQREKYQRNPEKGRAKNRRWRSKNKDKVKRSNRRNHLQHYYKMSENDFSNLLSKQNFQCAICQTKKPGGKKRFHVDHCHETQKIRGLLCNNCNRGLGYFKDDIIRLKQAIIYLKKNHPELID